MARKRLGEILIEAQLIEQGQLESALAEQRLKGGTLGRILLETGMITEEQLVNALAAQMNIEIAELARRSISSTVLDLVPVDFCERNELIPFRFDGKHLDLAMADPTDLNAVVSLQANLGLQVRVYLAGPVTIERAIARIYRGKTLAPSTGASPRATLRLPAIPPSLGAPSASTPPSPPPAVPSPDMNAIPNLDAIPPPPIPGFGTKPAKAAAPPGQEEIQQALANLHTRVDQLTNAFLRLESLVERDEDVLRRLISILTEKGVWTREEIARWLSQSSEP